MSKPFFKILGQFELGYESVQLVARDDTGGEFHLCSPRTNTGVITIGVDQDDFESVVAVLMHEAVEFSIARRGCRFLDSNDMGEDHAGYLFVMNHPQFSDIIAKSASFILPAIPLLRTVWTRRK